MRIRNILFIVLLMAASVLLPGAGIVFADSGHAGDHQQQILLDPDTGDITQVPDQTVQTDGDGKPVQDADGYTSWQTEDGTQMIGTDPSSAVKERVVHCPDGSLRMGHTGHGDKTGSDDTVALCARH